MTIICTVAPQIDQLKIRHFEEQPFFKYGFLITYHKIIRNARRYINFKFWERFLCSFNKHFSNGLPIFQWNLIKINQKKKKKKKYLHDLGVKSLHFISKNICHSTEIVWCHFHSLFFQFIAFYLYRLLDTEQL